MPTEENYIDQLSFQDVDFFGRNQSIDFTLPFRYASHSNQIYIKFVSDCIDDFTKGFKLSYTSYGKLCLLWYSGGNFCCNKPCFMQKMTNIQQASLNSKSAITLKPSELHFGIDWCFKMRYCITFYLNQHRNYKRSNLNAGFLLSKIENFNFDLL